MNSFSPRARMRMQHSHSRLFKLVIMPHICLNAEAKVRSSGGSCAAFPQCASFAIVRSGQVCGFHVNCARVARWAESRQSSPRTFAGLYMCTLKFLSQSQFLFLQSCQWSTIQRALGASCVRVRDGQSTEAGRRVAADERIPGWIYFF